MSKETIYFVNGGRYTKLQMVIKGLEQCTMPSDKDGYETQCLDCPYFDPDSTVESCKGQLCVDAISLLKEQEAMLVEYSAFGGMKYGGCPRCNARIDNIVNPKACGYCGQAVKWK